MKVKIVQHKTSAFFKKCIFLFLILLSFSSLYSQGSLISVTNKVEGGYNFWLHSPGVITDPGKPVPLILFLHGRSLSGSNLELVKRYGILNEVIRRRKLPAYVLAPQCPKGQGWNPERILKVVNYIQKKYNTDTNRLYVAGMSLGGYGVLHFTGAFPEKVAAAAAFCGGGNVKDCPKLATVPLWIVHGTADRAVSYLESQRIVDGINKVNQGINLKYDLLKGAGHGEPSRLFSMDEFYQWLFMHSKDSVQLTQKDTISVDHKRFAPRHSKKKKSKKKKKSTKKK